LPGFAGFSSPLGTPVVQRGPGVGEGRYLGVREYARLLGVSRATVYRALARGEIGHVRVSSAIRIPVGAARS
jgi:excisionase family DNA binding protein